MQRFAVKAFHADEAYLVLNGISAANKVVANALLTRDDLVLSGCSSHKSNHYGAPIQAGATPAYLEISRNPFGFIGGIDAYYSNEEYLRQQIRDIVPEKTDLSRPYCLAIIQLGTYDDTAYNARQAIDTIGYLCDYILFNSAWVGCEQFISMMAGNSPLLLELNENDPGIFVTQSVHRQQAGLSQASQIHEEDNHIRGQARLYPYKRLNDAFTLHASISPFYPLFVVLDVNAKIYKGESRRRLRTECAEIGIEACKATLVRCKLLRLFIPSVVDDKLRQDHPISVLANDRRFFSFESGTEWYDFGGRAADQYFVDPCKLLLTMPDIGVEIDEYSDFGVPATIPVHHLRENGIVPEKCDLSSIPFLLAPAESHKRLA